MGYGREEEVYRINNIGPFFQNLQNVSKSLRQVMSTTHLQRQAWTHTVCDHNHMLERLFQGVDNINYTLNLCF